METIALILAGGKGSRLDILSERRSKPAVPFAGKYRIIDFTLSNCAQSGIYDILIMTQYLPFSLNEHIKSGKPWDLDRRDSSVVLLQPHDNWYQGTADAVLQNMSFVKRKRPKYVLILSGDHIYKMDYRKMIDKHKESNAKVTIATQEVLKEDTHRFGMMGVNELDEIVKFEEKPKVTDARLASMGIYLFDFEVLDEMFEKVKDDNLDFGKHIIPYLIYNSDHKVVAYRFNKYWKDVGTYDSYLETSLDLIKSNFELDLHDDGWKVYTRSEDKPPAKITEDATIKNSLISNGCVIEGTVINSVLSPGVYVGRNTIVKDSVILNDVIIGHDCMLDKVILDKKVVVGNNSKLGYGDDFTPNKERPDLLTSGITVVERKAIIPSNTTVGRNCRIFRDGSISTNSIASGETIK